MALRVRRATLDDARQIARVHVGTWRAAYTYVFSADYLAGLSVDERTELWTRTLSDGAYDVLVIELEGRVAGFASAGPTEDEDERAPPGELYAIYVDPAAWGLGLGCALLTWAEEALREAGFDEAALWVLEEPAGPAPVRGSQLDHGWSKEALRTAASTAVVRYRKRLA